MGIAITERDTVLRCGYALLSILILSICVCAACTTSPFGRHGGLALASTAHNCLLYCRYSSVLSPGWHQQPAPRHHQARPQVLQLANRTTSRDARDGFATQQARAFWWNANAPRLLRNLRRKDTHGFLELVTCPERKLVFSHIYKAGGSTVDVLICLACPGATCYLSCGSAALSRCNCGFGRGLCELGRKRILARQSLEANEGVDSRMAAFTVVREPVSRFHSAVSQLKFLQRVSAGATCGDVLRTIAQRGLFDSHLYPQSSFMVSISGTPLRFKHIFLLDEISMLQEFLGLEQQAQPPAVQRLSNTAPCSAQDAREIERLYSVDVQMYDALRMPTRNSSR